MYITAREYVLDLDLYTNYTVRMGSKTGLPVYKVHPHAGAEGQTCLVASIVNGHYSHARCPMSIRLHLTPVKGSESDPNI